MKFVWNGSYDAYESSYAPTLLDENKKIIWQGGIYYGGSEVKANAVRILTEIQSAAQRHKVDMTGYKFYSNNPFDWGLEDNRTPS